MKDFELTISKYSYYDTNQYYVRDCGDRIASVFDKLIELAARKCDSYASDVFWDMRAVYHCIEEGRKLDRILLFRESGVHSIDIDSLRNYSYLDAKSVAAEKNIWRLEHKLFLDEFGKTQWETVLTRVKLDVKSSFKNRN